MQPSDLLTIIAIAKKEADKAIAALPPVSNGIDGKDGVDGKDGRDGINGIDGQDGADGLDGANGHDGVDGKDGAPGKDGRDGRDGKDGSDGKDGRPGQDGIGVEDALVDDRGHLIIGLSDGSEIDAGKVKGDDGRDGKDGRDGVVIVGGGGGSSSQGGGGLADTFETVSKNLAASDAVFTYGVDGLETVTYVNGIVKTLAYSPNGLASVTLSGNTPSGIDLVKTFQYSGGNLVGFAYS